MQIRLRLHGILRDKLPAENKGRTTLELDTDATIQSLHRYLAKLDIHGPFETAVNGDMIDSDQVILNDGDRVEVFLPVAGG